MPHEDWRVVEYRGRAALELLEADWRRLYAAMPTRSSAQLYEAHLAFFDHLMRSPERFRCLALTDGRGVRAICPLEARVDRSLGVPLPAWAIPRHLLTPVADAVYADDEAARALAPAVVAYLRPRMEGRSLLVLGPAPVDCVLWEGVERLDPSRRTAQVTHRLSVFDCEQSFDELMSRLGKHFRRNLRSHRKKLDRLDAVRFVTAADKAALGAALEQLLEIEASGWKGATGTRTAIRFKPRQPGFFKALATTFDGDDRCEINELYVEDRCIASEFCIRTGGEYARIKIGYDEAFSTLGPGQLVLLDTLERLCHDPDIRCFNMMSGAAWLDDWRPDKLVLQQTHVALGRWSGVPLTMLLRFRFGPGRAIARSTRRRFEDWREQRRDKGAPPSAKAAPEGGAKHSAAAQRRD